MGELACLNAGAMHTSVKKRGKYRRVTFHTGHLKSHIGKLAST